MIIAEIVEQINLQEKIEKKLNRKETKTLQENNRKNINIDLQALFDTLSYMKSVFELLFSLSVLNVP
ncbi:MAG: hypothetical protein GX927_13140 [Lentisphaerae bacterium]|jgi:hypothetical protein|nr:hypothetical protein [Lentisphaerota bacterium]